MSHPTAYDEHLAPSHDNPNLNAASKASPPPTDARLYFCETLLDEYEYIEHPLIENAAVQETCAAIRQAAANERRSRRSDALIQDTPFDYKAELLFNSAQLKKLFSVMACQANAATTNDAKDDEAKSGNRDVESLDKQEGKRIEDELKSLHQQTSRSTAQSPTSTTNGNGNSAGNGQPPVQSSIVQHLKLTAQMWGATSESQPREVLSALCLSGGGIRSATFNLGILQGLARHGLLERFNYLSTVSGGGFIGGWLTALIHRQGLKRAMRQLGKADDDAEQPTLVPDADPVDHLRVYANYLSPQPGLFSIDTWTLGASVARNLLLTWLIFVPWIIFALLLPRLWVALSSLMIAGGAANADGIYLNSPVVSNLLLASGGVLAIGSFLYIGFNLPLTDLRGINDASKSNSNAANAKAKSFVVSCLLPMTLAAMCWLIYIARQRAAGVEITLIKFVLVMEIVGLAAWGIAAMRIALSKRATKHNRKTRVRKLCGATLLIGIGQAVTGALLWLGVDYLLPLRGTPINIVHTRTALIYATFGVPLVLLVFALGGTLVGGFTSRYAQDDDQEWWARAGGYIARLALVWIAIHLLVFYAPLLFEGWSQLPTDDLWSLVSLQVISTVIGIASGAIALIGGFSSQTSAHESDANAGRRGSLLSGLTVVVAPVALAFIFAVTAFVSSNLIAFIWNDSITFILNNVPTALVRLLPTAIANRQLTPALGDHISFVAKTELGVLLFVLAFILVFAWAMSRLINSNRFSLHAMWRNRVVRAYLGASRTNRQPNSLTNFDLCDNLFMHELCDCAVMSQPDSRLQPECPPESRTEVAHKPVRRLLHVINIALNLTGGAKLQWQERKAESFTVSPLHAGSYWLGYRHASRYGGKRGISLGTAVAISGAFVSPNMGYMMTSPAVRFLMTLFNVRFGWWLGNPGAAGERTNKLERWATTLRRKLSLEDERPFERAAPYLSAKPILEEAAGLTNDYSPYVYLSDGGHFDNLGLYEMVLRRARFIVVSDASTDPTYAFQSLAASVRQIRVDFGIPIEFDDFSITNPAQDFTGKYCAVGRIRYSCVDKRNEDKQSGDKLSDDAYDGILIYIKPSLIGSEPRDVVNYARTKGKFPQEVITDQWFSEAQFESYRTLGSYIIDAILETKNTNTQTDFATFARRAELHNQIDFRAFRKQIDYAAFQHEFINGLNQPPRIDMNFGKRVREYMNRVMG